MSREQNEGIAQTYVKACEMADRSLFEQVLAPHFVDSMHGRIRGREALLEQACDSVPGDRQLTIDDEICK